MGMVKHFCTLKTYQIKLVKQKFHSPYTVVHMHENQYTLVVNVIRRYP